MFSTQQAANPNVKKFVPGEVIAAEGANAAEMYVVIEGTAGIYKNYKTDIQQELGFIKANGFFGETSLFLGKLRNASLVGLSDGLVMRIDRQNALGIFGKQPDIAYSIMGEFCRRLDAVEVAAPVADSGKSRSSKLFPPEHGSYKLPLSIFNDTYVYEQRCTCPLCGQEFEHLTALGSRLRRTGTDRDMRVRYAEVEPMYYDVASCPNCLYSAPLDLFPNASKRVADQVAQEIGLYRGNVVIKTGKERDTFTIFAGYYLALKCVPRCFDEYQLTTAGMWQKLSRLYKDCEDEKMYLYASENAIKDYEHVYGHFHISDKQTQQVCFILGDLYERTGNLLRSQENFFRAKSMRDGTSTFKMQADIRLEDLKVLLKKEKEKEQGQAQEQGKGKK